MGKSVVILGAGDFPKKEYPLYILRSADIVICCDSAFGTWLRKSEKIFGEKRLPYKVVGDLDSLSPALQKRYSDLIVHYSEQDYNDLTKALRYALSEIDDISSIHFLGATGRREDHTIGNMSLLMEYPKLFNLEGIEVEMVSDYGTMFAITDSCELYVGEGRPISIFVTDNSLKIKSEGLQWKTDDVVFDNLWKATLNRATSDMVRLSFSHKSAALIVLPA